MFINIIINLFSSLLIVANSPFKRVKYQTLINKKRCISYSVKCNPFLALQ